MTFYSPEQLAQQTMAALKKSLRENNTPEKARAFLLRCGIIEKHKGSPNGVRLAKRFR